MMNLNKPSLFLSIKIMQGIIEINVAINMWLNSITDFLEMVEIYLLFIKVYIKEYNSYNLIFIIILFNFFHNFLKPL